MTALRFYTQYKAKLRQNTYSESPYGISLTNEIIFITPTINYVIVYQYILDMTNDCDVFNLIISNDP